MDKMALRRSQEIPNHSKRFTGAQIIIIIIIIIIINYYLYSAKYICI